MLSCPFQRVRRPGQPGLPPAWPTVSQLSTALGAFASPMLKPQRAELKTGACTRDEGCGVGCGWCILEANKDLVLVLGAAVWVEAAWGGLVHPPVPAGEQIPPWHQQLCRAKVVSSIYQHLAIPVAWVGCQPPLSACNIFLCVFFLTCILSLSFSEGVYWPARFKRHPRGAGE